MNCSAVWTEDYYRMRQAERNSLKLGLNQDREALIAAWTHTDADLACLQHVPSTRLPQSSQGWVIMRASSTMSGRIQFSGLVGFSPQNWDASARGTMS